MNEALTTAIVELAKLAVIAYAIKNGRDVITHWLDKTPTTPTKQDVIDQARSYGLEIQEREA